MPLIQFAQRLRLRHTAIAKRTTLLGFSALLVLSVSGCAGNTDPEAATAGADNTPVTEAPELTPEQAAEAQAAEQAAWEAQQKRLQEVVGAVNRDELIGDSATKGPQDAEVVMIKFSDFECPYCSVASADMKDFAAANEDSVLYVYKHLPLTSIHPEAMPAALATWAAAQQDQFWIYHDGLFAYQDKLGEDYYVELAEQIGLDMEKFNRDRNSPEAKAAIEKDMQLAQDLGLTGTPSFLMTNFKNNLILPGGAPLELYNEAAKRLQEDAAS